MKLALLLLFIVSSCGRLEDSLTKFNPFAPVSNSLENVNSNAIETITPVKVSPGSYYGLIMDDGEGKDIVVHEFQYLSEDKFIIKETRFLAGNITRAYFHSTTGTYAYENGVIKHTVLKDSCDKLSAFDLGFTGDKASVVKTTFRQKSLSLYSFSKFQPPLPLLSQLGNATEDSGCTIFP